MACLHRTRGQAFERNPAARIPTESGSFHGGPFPRPRNDLHARGCKVRARLRYGLPRRPGREPAIAMRRTIFLYALALAVGTWLLEWLKYRHFTQVFTTEIYVALLAVGFIALGIWVGHQLTPRPKPVV